MKFVGAVSILKSFYLYSWDSVTIYEGPTTGTSSAGPYCGSTLPPSYTSTEMYAAVKFVSDHVVVDDGFSASYSCIAVPTIAPTTTVNTTTQEPSGECGKNLLRNKICLVNLYPYFSLLVSLWIFSECNS